MWKTPKLINQYKLVLLGIFKFKVKENSNETHPIEELKVKRETKSNKIISIDYLDFIKGHLQSGTFISSFVHLNAIQCT